jgi:hypothetical protein
MQIGAQKSNQHKRNGDLQLAGVWRLRRQTTRLTDLPRMAGAAARPTIQGPSLSALANATRRSFTTV